MTPEQLVKLYSAVRSFDRKSKNVMNCRADLSNMVYMLWKGVNSIENHEELSNLLMDLYTELESVDSLDLFELVGGDVFWEK